MTIKAFQRLAERFKKPDSWVQMNVDLIRVECMGVWDHNISGKHYKKVYRDLYDIPQDIEDRIISTARYTWG